MFEATVDRATERATQRYYGWVPTLTGWLSFRSTTPYVFKGFQSDFRYKENSKSRVRFYGVAGRNLNDAAFFPDWKGRQKFIFNVEARRKNLNGKSVERPDQSSEMDCLVGYVHVHLPGSWLFANLRIKSLFGNILEQRSTGDKLASIFFILDRRGNCILRCGNLSQIDPSSRGEMGWLVAQCFLALKDFFHTHIAHDIATDSGLPLVKIGKNSENISFDDVRSHVAMKMRRRLHRKYSILVQRSPQAAQAYLTFLRVYIQSVGGYPMDGTTNFVRKNPLLDESTFNNAEKMLDLIQRSKRESMIDIMGLVFSVVAIGIALVGTYFQIIGTVHDNSRFMSMSDLIRASSQGKPEAIYALTFGLMFFCIFAYVIRISRFPLLIDKNFQYLFGTYIFENIQNFSIKMAAKFHFPVISTIFLMLCLFGALQLWSGYV